MNGKANVVKKLISTPEFSSFIILIVMVIITASFQENFFEQKSLVRTINAYLPLILMAMGQAQIACGSIWPVADDARFVYEQ